MYPLLDVYYAIFRYIPSKFLNLPRYIYIWLNGHNSFGFVSLLHLKRCSKRKLIGPVSTDDGRSHDNEHVRRVVDRIVDGTKTLLDYSCVGRPVCCVVCPKTAGRITYVLSIPI